MDWLPLPYRQNIPGFDYDLEAMRKKYIGVETTPVQGSYPVEYDAIRRHSHMTKDLNPLYLDPEYAAKSKYGAVIVPPPLVIYFAGRGNWPPRSEQEPTLPSIPTPGLRPIAMSVDTEWPIPVKVGDRLSVKSRYSDLYFLSIRLDWCAVWSTTQNIITNQRGETVAIVTNLGLRHRAADQVPEGQKGPPNVAPAAAPPMPQALGEHRPPVSKGRNVRLYWEDVKEGDALPLLEHPITETCIAEQVSGSQDFQPVHHDRGVAKSAGHADIFVNNGFTRGCAARVVTDWMGDEGWLRKFRVDMRRMNRPGDVMVLTGKVQRKYVEKGDHLVDCQVWIEQAREGIATVCQATVVLPTRS
ncbi:MAG: hypothetical protein EXR60_01325 [Dehalococcoidia bacterium]|nr:hypothetical protein [Dehalococcoidia bacterium]